MISKNKVVAQWYRGLIIHSVKGNNSNTTPDVKPGFVRECTVTTCTRKSTATSCWVVSGWGLVIIPHLNYFGVPTRKVRCSGSLALNVVYQSHEHLCHITKRL